MKEKQVNYMLGYQEIELLDNEYIVHPDDGTPKDDYPSPIGHMTTGPALVKVHIFQDRSYSYTVDVVKRPAVAPTWVQIATQTHIAAEKDRECRAEVARQESQDWLLQKLVALGADADTLVRNEVTPEVYLPTVIGSLRFRHYMNENGYPSELVAIDTGRGFFTPVKNMDELGEAILQWYRQHGVELDPLTGRAEPYKGD